MRNDAGTKNTEHWLSQYTNKPIYGHQIEIILLDAIREANLGYKSHADKEDVKSGVRLTRDVFKIVQDHRAKFEENATKGLFDIPMSSILTNFNYWGGLNRNKIRKCMIELMHQPVSHRSSSSIGSLIFKTHQEDGQLGIMHR